jgi:hypothetical protein
MRSKNATIANDGILYVYLPCWVQLIELSCFLAIPRASYYRTLLHPVTVCRNWGKGEFFGSNPRTIKRWIHFEHCWAKPQR